MPEIKLFFAPSTCARVPLTVLEHIGCDYSLELVRFMKGQHRSPDYLKLNPKGKVPCLVYDGEPLTENVAILGFLNRKFPEAKLLPAAADEMEAARQIADLCFCSATLHPIVTRIRMPMFFGEGEDCTKAIYASGVDAMRRFFDVIEQRLQGRDWWYGNAWSVLDPYLYWVWFRVTGAGFPGGDYPKFAAHAARVEALPATQRMQEREAELSAQLRAEGLEFVPPPLPR